MSYEVWPRTCITRPWCDRFLDTGGHGNTIQPTDGACLMSVFCVGCLVLWLRWRNACISVSVATKWILWRGKLWAHGGMTFLSFYRDYSPLGVNFYSEWEDALLVHWGQLLQTRDGLAMDSMAWHASTRVNVVNLESSSSGSQTHSKEQKDRCWGLPLLTLVCTSRYWGATCRGGTVLVSNGRMLTASVPCSSQPPDLHRTDISLHRFKVGLIQHLQHL